MASGGLTSSARRIALLRGSSRRVTRLDLAASRHLQRQKQAAPAADAFFSKRSSSSNPRSSTSSEVSARGSATPAVVEQDHLAVAKPLDFDMASKVDGQESQMVTFELEPGQVIRAEAGNLVFMEDGIEMDTNTGGGASSMFRRVITGQNMFITDYINRGDRTSKVGLGTDVPSKIIRLPLSAYGGAVICQRGAFLAGSHTIDIQTEFTKMMAGFFGGEGFILQRLTGTGDAFVKASGPLVQRELKDGETLRVSSGSVVAFSTSVQYDVQTIPGFKNVVFGGEGLFITKLTGPGMVYLQGLPFDRMVDQIARRIPRGAGGAMPIPVGFGGGGSGDGGEGSEDGAEGGAAEGAAGGEAASAAVATESTTNASDAGAEGVSGDIGSGSSTSDDLFGDAVPKTSASSSSSGFGDAGASGGGAQAGFEEPDVGFSQPPPDSEAPEEKTWSETGFEAEDAGGSGDDYGEGMDDEMEGTGGGIVGTLKKLYTFFGGDD